MALAIGAAGANRRRDSGAWQEIHKKICRSAKIFVSLIRLQQ
jgi:hypothetical protein